MMNKLNIFCVLFVFLTLAACKNDSSKSSQAAKPEVVDDVREEFGIPETAGHIPSLLDEAGFSPRQLIQNQIVNITPAQIAELRAEAKAEIDTEWKASGKKAYIIIDDKLFEYHAILGGDEMSAPGFYDGYWIDFDQNLTYTYGYGDKVEGEGMYNFKVENMRLVMLDNDENIKPQSFELKIAGNTVIFIGQAEYRDANMQGKMVRVASIPQK